MQNRFHGKWNYNENVLEIKNRNKTFHCSFAKENIGITFRDSLFVAEFDDNIMSGGIGVYSPIGDGSSNFALWSSANIIGSLGSGIALKSDDSEQFVGAYSVRYFIGKNETQSFTVKIEPTKNNDIYTLSWFQNEVKVLHGVGTMFGDSLAFAWGSIDYRYHFHAFRFCENDVLEMQTVKWDSIEIEHHTLTKTI